VVTVEGVGLVYAATRMARMEIDASGNVTEVAHGLHSEDFSALSPYLTG
jgi:hypothetical protein